MIYRKSANFPYPILATTSPNYNTNFFEFEVHITEYDDEYQFEIEYELKSIFIQELLAKQQAQLIFIIQSKDSKFYRLESGQTKVTIAKSGISLDDRTSIQLHIQALEEIKFSQNNDLNEFYLEFKEELKVSKYKLLGYSNVVVFDGSIRKPYELFAKVLDENLKSDIKIELGRETINIHYRKEDFQFNNLSNANALNNAYIYAGLTKALQSFIFKHGREEEVDIEEIVEPSNSLDLKLFKLMKNKKVSELHADNIDEVIYLISDRIIDRFHSAVMEVDM